MGDGTLIATAEGPHRRNEGQDKIDGLATRQLTPIRQRRVDE